MGVRGGTRWRTDVATGLNDAVEGATVHDQVLDDREGLGPPRLHRDGVTVLEAAHVQLAGGGDLGAVRLTVDHHTTGTADALAAVVVESDRVLVLERELLVEHVEHLEEGHVRRDVRELVRDHPALVVTALLSPHAQGDVHL